MNRSIALAYAITGLAVAAALVAIVGTTAGLFGSRDQAVSDPAAQSLAAPADGRLVTATDLPTSPGAATPQATSPTLAAQPEVVYVDAPAPRGDRDDRGRDDRDRHEDHEDREHEREGDDD